MSMGKDSMLGDGIAVDKLSVGRDKGVAVETPGCTKRHADNERVSRQTEMRIRLKNNLGRIGHLCYSVIYRLFIIAERVKQIAGRVSTSMSAPGREDQAIVHITVIGSIKFQQNLVLKLYRGYL